MKIGYVPFSQDLQHPADRRRIKILSELENIEIAVRDLYDLDVLVLSNSSNFMKYYRKHDCPIVIDLVDAYLADQPRFLQDFGRNVLRSLNGRSSLRFLRYTDYLKYACRNADAVVVATIEQSKFIDGLNRNVHVIIDDQSEMTADSTIPDEQFHLDNKSFLFWEGLGYTLKHFKSISSEIEDFLLLNNYYLKLLTNLKFHRWGGFLGTTYTEKLVRKIFPRTWDRVEVIPWSIEATKKAARLSTLGIIPITKSDKFAMFKPENKLISMWAMGIPVLCSPTSAYARVAHEINAPAILCEDNWLKSLELMVADSESREDIFSKGIHYYNKNCTREILQLKWLAALNSVLKE